MLSVILPTYNEAENLQELIPALEKTLASVPHEVIVVDDDSPDRTWETALQLAQHCDDLHVIRRMGRRGLSSAVMEGFLAAKGNILAVMDADGQHDAALLPRLAEEVERGAGIAIGSRYVQGGSVGAWDERRYLLSRIATRLATRLCKVRVADPMSGFFAMDRALFQSVLPRLNPKGFKILLDMLVHIPRSTKVVEIPFTFGTRRHGESKLSRRVQMEFLEYLYEVVFGRCIPLIFVKYCIVGALGVGVHLTAFSIFSAVLAHGLPLTFSGFSLSVLAAIETAIIFNFWLNNIWTFAHARLRGMGMLLGFAKYNVACAFGALANYAVSAFLFSLGWGEFVSVVVGAVTGIVWNYTMSRIFAWRA